MDRELLVYADAGSCGLPEKEARSIAGEVGRVVKPWRKVAAKATAAGGPHGERIRA
jgi:hypothetical protein